MNSNPILMALAASLADIQQFRWRGATAPLRTLNQRQRRKAWRNSPATRPSNNIR